MNFELSIVNIADITAEVEVIFVVNNDMNHHFIQDKKLLKKDGFTGGANTTCLLLEKNRLYIGTDSLKGKDLRPAAAHAIRALLGKKYKHIKVATYLNKGCTYSLRAMVEGFILGAYTFETYKSNKEKNPIEHMTISLQSYEGNRLEIQEASVILHKAQVIAEATNFTRDIVNTTPEDCYPKVLAEIAQQMAKDTGLSCHILKPKAMRKEKMETLLAVARASRHKPRVIHLSHKPKNPKKVVTLVGKGLTYDSGGLSLKPADSMVTMKLDKSGGSAVIGIMKAIAELNLPIEVHGFIGAVENMIGGDAYKPDDVLIAKNGKSIEVRNTDAEGRLVLADLLCYAQQEVQADYLFDFATLTGACVVGLGHYTSGIMGNSSQLNDFVAKEAKKSGELATALDFNPYLKKTLKSSIADLSNISNTRYGGAITAGHFLSEFIDTNHSQKWAHIDIAGPAFVEHVWGENPHGASGAGVRLMIKLIETLAGDKK